ncbi:MAG: hypothetical protein ACYDBK_06200, partial [Thermoplasmataceae archaeon]
MNKKLWDIIWDQFEAEGIRIEKGSVQDAMFVHSVPGWKEDDQGGEETGKGDGVRKEETGSGGEEVFEDEKIQRWHMV